MDARPACPGAMMRAGTVKTRLLGGMYTEENGFAEDVRLTFSNAMTFNAAQTPVHEDASKLSQHFDRKFAATFQHYAPVASSAAADTHASSGPEPSEGGAAAASAYNVQPTRWRSNAIH